MEPVTGDPKDIVRQGYDECGPRYAELRDQQAPAQLYTLIDLLPDEPSVLDVGCGAGRPVGTTLAGHARVTGVDISETQIRAARAALPQTASLIHADIMTVDLPLGSFDAAVCIFTLFHLPRGEHHSLLGRLADWLKPDGLLLLTTAQTDHPGYTESDFCGSRMYWSHYGPEWYAQALVDLGFEIVERGSLPPGKCDDVGHPTLLARFVGSPGAIF